MPHKSLTPERVLAMLAEGPARIAAATAGLSPERLHAAPGTGQWSANDVLAHLRACADVWGGYMATMLAQDRPSFRAISPRSYIHRTGYSQQAFDPSFQAFARQRTELLAVLRALTPEQWQRGAVVPPAGRVRQPTVLSYAQRLALHEREHLEQIERLAA